MKNYQLRRHKNIIAIKTPENTLVAFHSGQMQVAEVSEDVFQSMTPISFLEGDVPGLKKINQTLNLNNPTPDLSAEALTELNEWDQEIDPQAKNGHLNFGIRSLTINVNQICNLKCVYCAAGGDGTYGQPTNQIEIEKTLPQIKMIIERLKPRQKIGITFVGGEPLLHPQAIFAIYNYVNELSSQFQVIAGMTIVTNGTLLHGETLEIIKKMNIHLVISIDGPAQLNDLTRPTKTGQPSTEMTLKGLSQLATDRGQIKSIELSAVYSKQMNISLMSVYDFFASLTPDSYEFNFGYYETAQELQNDYIDEMERIAAKAWTIGQERELRKIKQFNHYFHLLDHQIKIENHCGAGKTYLVLDAKNNFYTCPWSVGDKTEIVGKLEQLDHTLLAKYQKSLIELNNCTTCWARHLCGGGCMHINKSRTGDKHTKDILFCERTRSLISIAIMYYKLSRESRN